jgi:hypothetical protein
VIFLTGCVKKYDEEKESDIDYTIVTEEEMPDQVKEILQASEKDSFRKTYSDKDYLYIIIGYGAQPTSGYSIEVQNLYQSSDAIFVTTMLKGPSHSESVLEIETYPSIVLKVEYTEKPVVFQ